MYIYLFIYLTSPPANYIKISFENGNAKEDKQL